ncbi:unnamed protein product [Gongylonema pulchrum]|uniref:GPI inositol-deacylase n=1 Tax=Gongylonema pulchrum TaxID=637853 RepID=A0A183DZN8_9BILA|nr:unnamed protein product [Gongylonema pulchrum]
MSSSGSGLRQGIPEGHCSPERSRAAAQNWPKPSRHVLYWTAPCRLACINTARGGILPIDRARMIGSDEKESDKKGPLREWFVNDFSHYSTVLYGEGEYSISFFKTGAVSGIPVVFVPGNAGSSRQVRSLGSVLHNKTESRRLPFTFDVFAVDFNEELSGLSGMYLERQIKYLGEAVRRVKALYSSPPPGIIFVGHSIGGIVIRSLLLDASFDPAQIAFIVTLGTPHKHPPLVFDWYMEYIYSAMHEAWKRRRNELVHLLVLSISGGLKDHLVPEHLTLDDDVQHVSTTAVDGIELEADHLCIVWCNQLVRRISRLMVAYATDPSSFHTNAKSFVQQLFDADGVIRNPTHTAVRKKTVLVVRHEPISVRNDKKDAKEFILLVSRGSWLFIVRSAGTSLWTLSGDPVYSLNTWRGAFYTLVHSGNSTGFSLYVEPKKSFQAVVLNENRTELSIFSGNPEQCFLQDKEMPEHSAAVHVGMYSLLKGCFKPLWRVDFSGHQSAVMLPITFASPAIAVLISLETVSCVSAKSWFYGILFSIHSDPFAKIEFRSRDLRRMSSLGDAKEVTLVGHLLHKEETRADTFFILDPRCRFRAHLDIGYVDSLIVVCYYHLLYNKS